MNSKRILSLIATLTVSSLLATSFAQGRQSPSANETNTWTVMVYVAADNDLESYWDKASLAMLLNLPTTDNVNFVAYVDLMSTQGTQIIEIEGGEWQVEETLEEMNFADDETLQWALSDVATRYPSDHLVVIAWDHGSAWNGFCGDYTSGDWMYLDELYAAIVGA